MIVRTDTHEFDFDILTLGRGSWVNRLQTVDGSSRGCNSVSDPFPTEREARKAARMFAKNARYDETWGWVA